MTADTLESMLRAVAPIDLDELPVYVGLETEVRFGMNPSPCGCWAFTGVGVDVDLRPYLGKRWRGRGVGIVIADNHVHNVYPPAIASLELLGLALHELAHNAEWLPLLRRGAQLPEMENDDEGHREGSRAFVQRMPGDGGFERRIGFAHHQFHTHGDKWIRAALHCWHRVRAMGYEVALPAVIDLGRSGVARSVGAWAYNRALGDEPARMAGCSFAEILETPLPSDFRTLWEMDCSTFADSLCEEIMTTDVVKHVARSENIAPYWAPLPNDVQKRRTELVAILDEDASAEAERSKPTSTLRSLELTLLRAKAKAARHELMRTAPERFVMQRHHINNNLEALRKWLNNKAHDVGRSEQAVKQLKEQAERAAADATMMIGGSVREIEKWCNQKIAEAKGAAARADQRRLELTKRKGEQAALLKELASLERKMLEVNPE